MKRLTAIAAVLLASIAAGTLMLDEEGFYRYPAGRGDVLVFASEGDLWCSAREGGD